MMKNGSELDGLIFQRPRLSNNYFNNNIKVWTNVCTFFFFTIIFKSTDHFQFWALKTIPTRSNFLPETSLEVND